MSGKKQKYYVVWKGVQPGIYTSWTDCTLQITNFPQAQYKSFSTLEEAREAFSGSYHDYKGKKTKKFGLSAKEIAAFGTPVADAVAVDAACSGNPGIMEYRGVVVADKKQIFRKGPFKHSTNNVGEFLALVHALALMQKNGDKRPIYSDSKIAIGWVKVKECRTKLKRTSANQDSFELVDRAVQWLKNNSYPNQLIKWETKAWGEIPADFGRK